MCQIPYGKAQECQSSCCYLSPLLITFKAPKIFSCFFGEPRVVGNDDRGAGIFTYRVREAHGGDSVHVVGGFVQSN